MVLNRLWMQIICLSFDTSEVLYEYWNPPSLHVLLGAGRSGGAIQFYYSFGMKLHLCFSLRPDRENFMAGIGRYVHTDFSNSPKIKCKWNHNLSAMQAESVMFLDQWIILNNSVARAACRIYEAFPFLLMNNRQPSYSSRKNTAHTLHLQRRCAAFNYSHACQTVWHYNDNNVIIKGSSHVM